MATTQGLIPSQQTRPNTVDSYYIRKGDPVPLSPAEITSADGTKTLVISEQNSGDAFIDNSANDGAVTIKPGADHSLVIQCNNTLPTDSSGLYIERTTPTVQFCALNLDQNGALNIIPSQGIVKVIATDDQNGMYITTGLGAIGNLDIGNIGVNGNITITPGTTQGAVILSSDLESSGSATSGLVVQSRTDGANAGLLIANNNSTGTQGYQFVVGGATAGGIALDHLQCYAYTNGGTPKEIFDFTPDGSSVVLGEADIVSGCNVGVNGSLGVGRVYDTAYNVPPTTSLSTIYTSPSTVSPGLIAQNFAVATAGLYQIQVTMLIQQSGGNPIVIPSGNIVSFVQRPTTPVNYRAFSEFNIISQQIIIPSLSGTSNSPTFASGIFEIPTVEDWELGIEVEGTWNFGTGGYLQYQLVKIN